MEWTSSCPHYTCFWFWDWKEASPAWMAKLEPNSATSCASHSSADRLSSIYKKPTTTMLHLFTCFPLNSLVLGSVDKDSSCPVYINESRTKMRREGGSEWVRDRTMKSIIMLLKLWNTWNFFPLDKQKKNFMKIIQGHRQGLLEQTLQCQIIRIKSHVF